MGLFSGITSAYKKSEAAVIVQNLLEYQARFGFLDRDPAKFANELVSAVWDSKPDVFEGKFGQRPFKITVAASALANGIGLFRDGDPNRDAIVLSLGSILSELETNGRLYPLNSLDGELIEASMATFAEIAKEFSESPIATEVDRITGSPEYATWEGWYRVFKVEAAKQNPQLTVDEEGISLIDLMEDEPLKRAFHDGVDPKALSKEFAEQFDITSFGQ
jgi:hypothetical protein